MMKAQVIRYSTRLAVFSSLMCFVVVGLTGCKTNYNTEAFINDLRATGASVRSEPLSDNIFGVPGNTVFINNNAVTVLEFPYDQQASDAVRGFWPEGSTLNPQGGWTEIHSSLTTRYYRKGALMVIYVGDNLYVTGILENLLGAQVGGNTLGSSHTP